MVRHAQDAEGAGPIGPLRAHDIDDPRKAFADLKHAGSSLNQCARALNTLWADGDSAASTDRTVRRVSAAADNICALIAAARR